jgi:ribosome-associated heat shock protein Hsp15
MQPDRHRIDLWLKLVCLVKHRSDAAEACRGGHVKVNGQRVKPASVIREGDLVELTLGEHYRKVVVRGLPEANVSKEVARTMYDDQTPPRERKPREIAAVQREKGSGRPTKRERREIDRFRR